MGLGQTYFKDTTLKIIKKVPTLKSPWSEISDMTHLCLRMLGNVVLIPSNLG